MCQGLIKSAAKMLQTWKIYAFGGGGDGGVGRTGSGVGGGGR